MVLLMEPTAKLLLLFTILIQYIPTAQIGI